MQKSSRAARNRTVSSVALLPKVTISTFKRHKGKRKKQNLSAPQVYFNGGASNWDLPPDPDNVWAQNLDPTEQLDLVTLPTAPIRRKGGKVVFLLQMF